MAKTSIRIDDDLFLAARHRSLDEGITFQELVERALKDYLKKPAPKGRKGGGDEK
jgi:hypothetical protein